MSFSGSRRVPSAGVLAFLALATWGSDPAAGAGERRPRQGPVHAGFDSTDAGAALPDSAAPPRDDRAAGRTVRRKTLAFDLVRFGRNVVIHDDEIVRGDVVVLGGDVRVDGEVQGGAVVLGGNLEVGSRGRVGGEALAVGGRVDVAAGAEVGGRVTSLGFLPRPLGRGTFDWRRAQRMATLVAHVVQLVLLVLACGLVALLAPRRLERARAELDGGFARSVGLGVLAATGGLFAVVMLFVLLSITLVGLPVAFLLAFATGLLLLGSLAVGSCFVGRIVAEALGRRARGAWASATVGVSTVLLPQLVADVVRLRDPATAATTLQFVHWALALVVLAAGLGAVLLTRLGAAAASPLPAAAAGSAPVEPPPAVAAPSGPA